MVVSRVMPQHAPNFWEIVLLSTDGEAKNRDIMRVA